MANIYDLKGKSVKKVELPVQFSEEYRPDLIKRAVLALETHQKQVQATKIGAGARFAAYRSKRRHEYKTTYGYNSSRCPGKTVAHSGTRFTLKGANVPQAVGGRSAHPPLVNRGIAEKINAKERKKAIRSAISATINKELVSKRGHSVDKINELPLIIINEIEALSKTKDVQNFLAAIGLEKEMERSKIKKVRAGKGKSRGRIYKKKKGPLFIVSKKCKLLETAKNIPGADVEQVKNINTSLLAPGTHPGRLTIWSEEALKIMKDKNMFM